MNPKRKHFTEEISGEQDKETFMIPDGDKMTSNSMKRETDMKIPMMASMNGEDEMEIPMEDLMKEEEKKETKGEEVTAEEENEGKEVLAEKEETEARVKVRQNK